jgi:hypothetical protein
LLGEGACGEAAALLSHDAAKRTFLSKTKQKTIA